MAERFDEDWGHWGKHWGRGFRAPRVERLRERIFGRGDLKYVILDMLRDQPRHGYDVIRELEGRFGGFYTPSAGAVYPTLQMLEDMGAVTAEQQEGRKVYTITDEGRRILEERRDVVDDIAQRVKGWLHGQGGSELKLAMRELGDLMAILGRESPRLWDRPDKLRQVREVIARTKEELRAILQSEQA